MRIENSRALGKGGLKVVSGGAKETSLEALERYQEKPIAQSTRRAYEADWADFAAWCVRRELRDLPAEPTTVARYLVERAAERSMLTLQRRVLVIRRRHEESGAIPPTAAPLVKNTIAHLRRERGTASGGKSPLLLEDLRLALDQLPETTQGHRDRALLLVGWAAALRRSELTALEVSDVSWRREGVVLTIRRSKTDQEGKGRDVGVARGRDEAYCPVRALRAWLDHAGIDQGPIFRPVDRFDGVGEKALSGEGAAMAVQRAVARIDLDPALYGGHSLRAGLATSAAMQGADLLTIMRQTGHRSQTVAASYVRAADLFRTNAASIAGL